MYKLCHDESSARRCECIPRTFIGLLDGLFSLYDYSLSLRSLLPVSVFTHLYVYNRLCVSHALPW
ncbi:hypothetical protein RSAG8_01148, partial [Rhizoctonia solani AG-8 WAC10335]